MLNTVFTNNTNENMISTVQTIDLTSPLQSTGGMALIGGLDRMEVLINDCTFNHNRASINNRHSTQFNPNGFGGAIKIHLIGTRRSLLIVNNSRFIGNMASQEGGAIYLSYSDTSIENEIVISNCIFNDNQVSAAAGGAISINSFRETFSNSFIIRDSTFTNNTANSGGAVSITLYESTKDTAEYFDIISFVSCTFNRNIAHNEGTAVGLVSLVYVDQSGFQIKFIDCHFEGNIPFQSTDNPVQLSSSVSSYRLFIQFLGTNVFLSNIGGAITLVKTRMLASGTLLFEENTAVFGPGIKMFDLSLLSVLPHTHITFSNNEAAESGGAIFVNIPPVNFVINIFNRLCFLQYQDQEDPDVLPQDWKNVSINFVNNTAGTSGGAIYASDMRRCGWLGDNYTTSNTIIFRPPRGLKSPFHFNVIVSYCHMMFMQSESTGILP
jgi:predicted outer membrane repeat protein